MLRNYYEKDREVILDQNFGFKIAFGVREYNTGITLDDPNFVQWNVFLTTSINSVNVERELLGVHRCTDEDYAELWPPNKS